MVESQFVENLARFLRKCKSRITDRSTNFTMMWITKIIYITSEKKEVVSF